MPENIKANKRPIAKRKVGNSTTTSQPQTQVRQPDNIPLHQVPQVHQRRTQNNFINCLQDPVERQANEDDPLFETLDQELEVNEIKNFINIENDNNFQALQFYNLDQKEFN
ncbi:unnamed protein product [Brachionus calyciflorus]|uniref:Uncharacterized protein n=1 Tax=Brachionus calyciflorus TaxID=104777 RepID=A0A813RUV4_9BILA|nr:unnamed protein product [Brachionus calyciflorus]